MTHDPPPSTPKRKARKWIWLMAVLAITGSIVFLWNADFVLFPQKQTSTVLVLDDCDPDFRSPPFEDALLAFHPNGTLSRMATNLNMCQTVGGNRALSVSPDGRFVVACETVGKHLLAYETQTAKLLWSADGEFTAATVGQNGIVYAAISDGTIYGRETVIIDQTGCVTRHGSEAGFDMALDEKRKVLWLVGKNIKKCDLELNLIQEINPNPIKWCAVSVDITPDGSIWVAEREHPNVNQSTNRILKISADGRILQSIYLDWSPCCLRIDPADGSIWVSGFGVRTPATKSILAAIEKRTGSLPLGKKLRDSLTERQGWPRTHKYDAQGNLQHELDRSGFSIAIDPSDGSVWLAGQGKVYRYSREGKKRAILRGVSTSQKYVVVLPPSATKDVNPTNR